MVICLNAVVVEPQFRVLEVFSHVSSQFEFWAFWVSHLSIDRYVRTQSENANKVQPVHATLTYPTSDTKLIPILQVQIYNNS